MQRWKSLRAIIVVLAILFYHFYRWIGMPEPDALIATLLTWVGVGRAR